MKTAVLMYTFDLLEVLFQRVLNGLTVCKAIWYLSQILDNLLEVTQFFLQ